MVAGFWGQFSSERIPGDVVEYECFCESSESNVEYRFQIQKTWLGHNIKFYVSAFESDFREIQGSEYVPEQIRHFAMKKFLEHSDITYVVNEL